MARLENIVPPLELCKRIPEGAFEDSALVWELEVAANRHHGEWWEVVYRVSTFEDDEFYPAPTLAEIMAELPKYDENEKTLACIPDFPNESGEAVFGAAWTVGYTKNSSVTDENPATAALKLWLELTGEGEHGR